MAKSLQEVLSSDSRIYASIDIGSNSMLLLIAQLSKGRLVPLHESIMDLKTAENLLKDKGISEAKVEKIFETLKFFQVKIEKYKAQLISVLGTEVFRKAPNGLELMRQIGVEMKVKGSLLKGEEEARYSYLALSHQLNQKHLAVADIGAGSTEISFPKHCLSYKVGALMLLEWGRTPEDYLRVCEESFRDLEPLSAEADLVGVGGTCTTLVMMHYGMEEYQSEAINGKVIERGQVENWIERLSHRKAEEKSLVGLPKNREKMILPGLCILLTILKKMKIKKMSVSTWSIRHGSILDAMNY